MIWYYYFPVSLLLIYFQTKSDVDPILLLSAATAFRTILRNIWYTATAFQFFFFNCLHMYICCIVDSFIHDHTSNTDIYIHEHAHNTLN